MLRSWLCTTRSLATSCLLNLPLELFYLCLLPRWLFLLCTFDIMFLGCSVSSRQSHQQAYWEEGDAGDLEDASRLRCTEQASLLCPQVPQCPHHHQMSSLSNNTPRGRTVQLLNIAEASITKLELPFAVSSVHPLSESQYLLVRCKIYLLFMSYCHLSNNSGRWRKGLRRSQDFMP